MAQIIEVGFKGNRRDYFLAEGDLARLNSYVIVEADRGEDIGRVTATGAIAERKCNGCSTGCAAPVPEKRVLRIATRSEIEQARRLRLDEERVRRMTRERVEGRGLKKKGNEAERQLERNKRIIYFTAARPA